MNIASLAKTVPGPRTLRPAYIKGFIRDFSCWVPTGLTAKHHEFANQPFAALNARPVEDTDKYINGVIFEVNQQELDFLKAREHKYHVLDVQCYDFLSQQLVDSCIVFSSPLEVEMYQFDVPAQLLYLTVCMDGARSFGQDFYQQFIDTTYINGTLLSATPMIVT